MEKRKVTIEHDGESYVFRIDLTPGEEAAIAARRATLCNGLYGQMINSPDAQEAFMAYNVHRITQLDGRLLNNPNDHTGFSNVSQETIDTIWKEWTEKSGLFRRPDEPEPDADSDDGSGEAKK